MSWIPFYLSAYDLVAKTGDYQKMANLGLPLYATIPATFLLGTAITYYNLREKVPELGDNINDVQKEKIKERFMQGLNETEYKPSLLDKLSGKIKRKSPLEVKADNLYRELSNLEVFEDNTVFPDERQKYQLSYFLGSEMFGDQKITIESIIGYILRKEKAETSITPMQHF